MNTLFIIGSPRSGTSLLRMLLTSHPEIVIPPECHFFLWLEEKYSSWDGSEGLGPFLGDLYASRKFETWGLDRSYLTGLLAEMNPSSYGELVEAVYIAYGKKNGKGGLQYWGDKNGLWRAKLQRVLYYFPEARIIHIVRDGRDVACSYKELAEKKSNQNTHPSYPQTLSPLQVDGRVTSTASGAF